MTGSLLATGASEESRPARAPIELRIEDRLASIATPIRGASAAMFAVLIGSLALHAVLLLATLVADWTPATAPQQEIAVEIVQEKPKPVPPAPAPAKAKPDVATPAPKVERPKPAAQRLPAAQPSAAKPEPPPAASKAPVVVSPPVAKTPPLPPAKPPADTRETEALQKELDELRAQRAALKAAPVPQDPAPSAGQHGGPLANSMQAIALPAIGAGDGDVAGYQEIVFSQLAKAKGDGAYHGQAGTTGVHFEVDADGKLVRADVAASSGDAALDAQALDIVRRAAPFPPPPRDADHSFFANVNFNPSKR